VGGEGSSRDTMLVPRCERLRERCPGQTSVAEGHNIVCTDTLQIGDSGAEARAEVSYNPKMHKDAGPILSDVKATYIP